MHPGSLLVQTSEQGEIQLRKSHSVRIAVAVWILYCLIITQSYAGNLKAYLTTPAYSKPIDTLQEVIESNLPWGMVLYGEEEEELMANSEDPIIQKNMERQNCGGVQSSSTNPSGLRRQKDFH